MPACHAAHRFPSLQRLLNQTNLLVVAPPTPTFRAQHLHLHSQYDLKARFKVTSSDEQPNYTRRPSPERYGLSDHERLAERSSHVARLLVGLRVQFEAG